MLYYKVEIIDGDNSPQCLCHESFCYMLQYYLFHGYFLFLSLMMNFTTLLQMMIKVIVTTDRAAAGAIWPFMRS